MLHNNVLIIVKFHSRWLKDRSSDQDDNDEDDDDDDGGDKYDNGNVKPSNVGGLCLWNDLS